MLENVSLLNKQFNRRSRWIYKNKCIRSEEFGRTFKLVLNQAGWVYHLPIVSNDNPAGLGILQSTHVHYINQDFSTGATDKERNNLILHLFQAGRISQTVPPTAAAREAPK